MGDIRLKTVPYELDGKTYQLCCNFNVLADIQEEFGGIPNIFDARKTLTYYAAFLAAMLNDYADSQGWAERFTRRSIGRKIDLAHTATEEIQNVIQLVVDALYTKTEAKGEDSPN